MPSSGIAGVVAAVADNATNFVIGDRKFGPWPGRFENKVRVPAIFCQQARPDDCFEMAATMPLAYCTAWHAIVETAQTQQGESILTQGATGAVGLAAINIARSIGAKVYATVGTAAKREVLIDSGVSAQNLFSSRDISAAKEIENMTARYRFDVILNVSSGTYLQNLSWPLIAPFGRFVKLRRSKNALIQGGVPAMKKLSEGTTFIPIDMIGLCWKKPEVITRIMTAIGTRYRSGVFATLPHETLPVPRINEAFSDFARFEHIGKLILHYSGTGAIPVFPSLNFTEFCNTSSYLVIDPLTMLAIEFIHWMIQKGVRRLVFLGSRWPLGADDLFIDGLTAAGISVTCFTGSAANINDVRRAMSSYICEIIEITGFHNPESSDKQTAFSDDDRKVTEMANALANLHSVSLERSYELDFFSISKGCSRLALI